VENNFGLSANNALVVVVIFYHSLSCDASAF